MAFLLCGGVWAQQVEYSEVEAGGVGKTEALAIHDGLKQCIAQVYGMSVASETRLEVVAATLSVNGADSSKAREKLNERIETATKGRIASYRMISPVQETSAGIEIRVAAKIARYKSGQQDSRLRLAFLPLRASQNGYVVEGDVELWQKDRISDAARKTGSRDGMILPAAAVSSQLLHALSQKIVSSRKFMVLDREYTDEIAAEQNTIAGSAANDDLCKLGAILGADYIVAGTIENFSVQNQTANAGDIAIRRKIGSAAIALRIIDVATGQIKFSQTINSAVTIRHGVSSASMDMAEQIAAVSAAKIMEAIYPLVAVAFENGELVLNQGGEMIKTGDKYELFALGEILTDPRTGESLGRKETKCGVVEIIRSKPKTSDAKVLESDGDLPAIIKTQTLLCRPMKAEPAQKPASLKQQSEKEKLW